MSVRIVTVRAAPSAELLGSVRGYSGFLEVHEHSITRVALPTPRVKINFAFTGPLLIDGSKCGSFVARPHDSAVCCEHAGFRHRINAIFTPLGACRFLGVPLGQLHPYTPLEDVLGNYVRELTERLAEIPTWPARFELLDRAIRERLAADDSRLTRDVGARALARIEETGGTIDVGALAIELGYTRKHIHERVRALAGVSPRAYASLLRFERVIHDLQRQKQCSLAAVARASGFYDQSHLHRDVRRFTATTPRELWGELVRAEHSGTPGRFVEPV